MPTVLGWKWVDRRLHRVAYRLTAGQFAALADGPLVRRSMTVARLVTLAAAVVLIAGVLTVAGLGVWLLLSGPGVVFEGLGVVLLGVAFVLRPRLGRLATFTEDTHPLERATAPELFALVERVAAEVHAPMPHVVLIGYDLNAFTTTVGLRRRRVLCLGLPLWATLDPQERVALIGHELGHFVNGDVRRGPLTRAAETTLGHIAVLFAPSPSGVGGIVEMISRSVGWVMSRTVMLLQLVLLWISQRDSQRAEYLADELGARAGGTAATIRLADHLLVATAIDTVISREARAGNGMPAWQAAAVTARTNQAPYVPLLRLLSRHTEASLFASHPPAGLRAEMLERRPELPAAVRLDEATSARIDDELSTFSERVRRVLADGGLAPVSRRRRTMAAVVAVLVLLGFSAYQLIKPHERAASIVVEAKFDARKADLDVIGPRLQGTPGVAKVIYVNGFARLAQTQLRDQRVYMDLFGMAPPDWYELTTRDQAAYDALEDGTFAEDLLAVPGVAAVYFGCPDLVTCAQRETRD